MFLILQFHFKYNKTPFISTLVKIQCKPYHNFRGNSNLYRL